MDFIYDSIRNVLQVLAQNRTIWPEFKYGFVINSFICACIIGPALGALGTIVIVKKTAFFSTAIANAAITGIALGILFGEPVNAPYISLVSFSLLFAIILNFVRNHSDLSQDVLIAVFLATAMAVGSALMFSVTRTINIHILDSFLFGSILTASYNDITLLAVTGVLALTGFVFFFNTFLQSGLHPGLASVRGTSVRFSYYLFVIMIALVTVASIKIVGAVLVEALLIIPAAASRNIARSLRSFVVYSIAIGTIAAVGGIVVPVHYNLSIPSGAAIIVLASTFFAATFFVRIIRERT